MIYGRAPNMHDIIKIEKYDFTTQDELDKWLTKKIKKKSIFWIDYTVTQNDVILRTANNVNLAYDGKNYRENR
jgi:hypothetical protein